MTYVYLVQHERPGTRKLSTIGIYSSQRAAAAAVERARVLPGLSDFPDGFTITPYQLNEEPPGRLCQHLIVARAPRLGVE